MHKIKWPADTLNQSEYMQADLLKEIHIVLQCKDSKLIDLPQDAVIIDNSRDEDVTLAD